MVAVVGCPPRAVAAAIRLSVPGHPRLWLTGADLPRLRAWASPGNPIWERGLLPVIENAISIYQSRFAPFYTAHPPSSPYPDPGDTQGYTGYLTEEYGVLLAFDSLVDPNPAQRSLSATWARNMLMFAMNQAVKGVASGAPFRDPAFPVYNRANGSGEEWPLIVDWIYPYLSHQDVLTIRDVFMIWARECLSAETTGGDHPAPIGATDSTSLLPGGKPYRLAANNYYLGHARLLTMMALAIDPGDDPPVNASLPASALGNTLRSYIADATGAWLYQEYAMFGEPAQIASGYGLRSGTGFGLADGGLPPEGMLYGHSFAYVLGQLLALQTAGFGTTALSGPQAQLIYAPVWDRLPTAFISSLVPAAQTFPNEAYMGPVYQMASYGDLLRLWITPDFAQPFALLALLDEQSGRGGSPNIATARWFAANALQGGAADVFQRMSDPYSYIEPLLYFLLFDPAAPRALDPRAHLPLTFVDQRQGRVISRTSWRPNATMFDYRTSWISINHQDADGGQFELYRDGEWLTKEMSNYDNNGLGQSSPYHNTLSLQNWAPDGTPSTLQWFEHAEWNDGSQWILGQNDGDPVTRISAGRTYTYADSDLTPLYNRRPDPFQPEANATDIKYASRSIVWLDGDFIVVYDRAGSRHAGLFKRFNLNLVTHPTIAGNIVREVTPRGQQLFVQTLLPGHETATVADAAADLSSVAELEPTRYQLAIEDPADPRDTRFLNVLQGADRGARLVRGTLLHSLSGTPFDGATFGRYAVFFVRDHGARVGDVTVPLPSEVRTLMLTGLRAGGRYRVVARRGRVSIRPASGGAWTADSAGALNVTGLAA